MAKQGMKREERTHTKPRNEHAAVPASAVCSSETAANAHGTAPAKAFALTPPA